MKTLISFLGTSPYKSAIYTFDHKQVETRFMQVALCKIFNPGRILIFTTDRAKQDNGPKLEEEIKEKSLPDNIWHYIEIPYANTEEEIWELFDILQKNIIPNDELIIDITHSFRSIPIISLPCMLYVSTVKQATIEGIYYGAFQGEGEVAPIVDITSFLELMEWSNAVSNFVSSGDIKSISNLTKRAFWHVESKQKDRKLKNNLNNFVGQFVKLQEHILTSRVKEIGSGDMFSILKNIIKILSKKQQDLPAPFFPLLNLIEKKVEIFFEWEEYNVPEFVQRGLGAVNWCLEHGLIQQGHTLLQENLVSYFCWLGGLDWKKKHPDRSIAAQVAAVYNKDEKEWGSPARDNKEVVKLIQRAAGEDLLLLYKNIADSRNDINHGFGSSKPDTFKKKLKGYVEKLKHILPRFQKLYILNSLIVPFDTTLGAEGFFSCKKISKEEFEESLLRAKEDKVEIVSALGHQDMVKFAQAIFSPSLSKLFFFNRIDIVFKPGDMGLVIKLKERLPEIKELDLNALRELFNKKKIEFYVIRRIR